MQDDLNKHKRSVHVKSGVVYKCDKCDYSTGVKHYLSWHVYSMHTKPKVFKCGECPYEAKF